MKSIAYAGGRFRSDFYTLGYERIFRRLVFRQLRRLERGQVRLFEDGKMFSFGSTNGDGLVVDVCIKSRDVYRRVALGGTIGAAESYMLGLWTCNDLSLFVRQMLKNQGSVSNMDSVWSWPRKAWSSVLEKLKPNTVSSAKKKIVAHYDLNNEFFSQFLDASMMYSSAIYQSSESTLEQAAEYKLQHICERLQLQPNDHLIEIGSGWGAMAIYAAKRYGCRVTTTTISDEQYRFAKQRIASEGLSDRILLLNKDYRLLSGQYDKLVSIEMIEAVGHRYYKHFFKKCSELLKDNGVALIQAITTGDHRFHKEKNKTDFIRKYIFPGGCLPSNQIIAETLAKYTDLHSVGYEDITFHYARTLRDWRQRFSDNIDAVKHLGFDDVFIRMWEFYLTYCEGGFDERAIHTGQFLFAKPQARCLPSIGV